jgi:phage terminase large subunit-like protein
VLETNNGGDWIPAVIEAEWSDMQGDESLRERLAGRPRIVVVTATRGKHVRAEPIATLYEQHGVVTHEPGLEVLEDQLVSWSPLLAEKSPDRLDALVWCLTYLSTLKRVVLT